MKRNLRIITIPNILSLFRLILIPVYASMYLNAASDQEYLNAGIILSISCITDMLDGWIARRFNQISDIGKILDPVADKLTQGVVLLCMAGKHPILWWVFGLLLIKELFQLIAGYLYLQKGNEVKGAVFSGKICTTVLFVSMILIMIFPSMPELYINCLAGGCIIFMLAAFGEYIHFYLGIR
ncbi:MAG: CDP-alcohol phosphatidyltransferase family protein [Lachnospiraceae bacterium]|nr:CDP-alcohol phosphatidyltransferase family protein [Lachnospiraceae bacterium]